MGLLRTLPVLAAPSTTAWRTPVYVGPTANTVAAVTFSITKNIATIVLGAGNLPTNGYNGPNGYIPTPTASPATKTQSQNAQAGQPFDIHGGVSSGPVGKGQQVILWGFTTATYFNGKKITVIDNNPLLGSFRFYFTNADVNSTADAGNTAPSPVERFRSVRIECDAANSTNIVYVGDLNVTATQYAAALTLAGQLAWSISGDNIDASQIEIFGSSATNCSVHVSLIY
jgi:hypothetical protein